MSTIPRDAATWKWRALTCLAMLVLSLIPQLHLWLVRGRDWNGAYVSPQGDEPLYSAYVNALIDGRTRKNDPYAAKDSTLASPLPESTFSIQFIPPYVISFLARVFGASASTAMLACIGLLWLYLRPSDRRKTVEVIITIGAIAVVALLPYAYLVSHRAANLDEQQTLILSHRPDLFRIPEIIGALILIALILCIRRQVIDRSDGRTVFAASFALFPIVVFNQQIFSGRSMQPYHYAAFIANYVVLVGLLMTVTLCWKAIPRRILIWIAALSFTWGVVEVGLPSRLNTVPAAVVTDQIVPVLQRLKELSKQDGTIVDLHAKGQASPIVFSPQLDVTVWQPTWTSQGTLLDMVALDFGSVSRQERKEYFYMHLYYSKADTAALRLALNGTPNDPAMNYYARAAIFGHERIVPALRVQFRPIQPEEIEQEIRAYQAYADSFSHERVLERPLTYAVIPADINFDFSNIDRWYERDAGERVGAYVLYRLKLRD